MPSIQCPRCGAILKSPKAIPAGKKVTCPKCKEAFIVAAASTEERKPAPPAQAAASAKEAEKKPDKPKKNTLLLLVGALGSLLLLCCCSCGGAGFYFRETLLEDSTANKANDNKDAKTAKDLKDVPKLVELKPDLKLTAEAMAKEFIADEKAAETKYKSKLVEVTGEVFRVMGVDQFHLKGADKPAKVLTFYTIRCGVPPDQQDMAARFSRGQKVKAVGKFSHVSLGFYATLSDCQLTALEPSKLLESSSTQLALEYEKDAKAAAAKNKDQDVIVTSPVEDVLKDKDGSNLIKLKGTAATAVLGQVGALDMDKVAKGQPITFRTDFDAFMYQNQQLLLPVRFILRSK